MDLGVLTDELEKYRDTKEEKEAQSEVPSFTLTAQDKASALQFLKTENFFYGHRIALTFVAN